MQKYINRSHDLKEWTISLFHLEKKLDLLHRFLYLRLEQYIAMINLGFWTPFFLLWDAEATNFFFCYLSLTRKIIRIPSYI